MAAQEEVTLVIRARDRTRAAFRNLRRRAGRLVRVFARVGAAIAAAFGGALIQAAQRFERISDAARFLGEDLRDLQALQILGRRFGVDADTIIDLLDEIRARAGEATLEGGEAAEAFERLGLTAEDLAGGPIQILDRLGAAIANSDLNANQLAATLDQLGGDAARRLLPLLEEGNLRGRIQETRPLTAGAEAVETGAEATRRTVEGLTVASNKLAEAAVAFGPSVIQALQNSPAVLGARNVTELLQAIARNTDNDGLTLD